VTTNPLSSFAVSGVLLSIGLAGCAVGPDHEVPESAAPAALAPAAAIGSATSDATRFTAAAPIDRWWEVFKDARLSQLVDEARRANQDYRAAIARVHIARALSRQAFAPLLPVIAGDGSYTYNLTSTNANVYNGTPGFNVSLPPYQLVTGMGDLSYELDLWGRVRRGLEATTAEEAATEEDRRNAEISLIADLAQTYFDLGAATESVAIARETVTLRTETLDLVRARVKAGVAAELELERGIGELETARADVPSAEYRRAIAEHRLAILLGHPADVRFEASPSVAFAIPPEVPVGVPSTLLKRRPDVRGALLRVCSSNARIGEAEAAYFPTITLNGSAGYSSVQWHSLAQPAAQFWSIGPSIHLPIFEGGRTYYTVMEKEARKDESIALYRSVVLRAFGEVADAMSGIASHAEVRDRQAAAVEALTRAVGFADESYKKGATGYLDVLDAQRALLVARNALLLAQRQVLSDMIQLEKALGGGWTESLESDGTTK
jgi:NodT family efflux transporter outer membrane factor (OMF) lipoprotein